MLIFGIIMYISLTHKITCLIMAFLMLFTSVGFSADVHFCKGEFKSFSLVGEASSCHTAKKSCPHHANMNVEDNNEKDCCTNEKFEVDDLDVDYNVFAEVELTDLQIQFVASLVYSLFTLTPPSSNTISPFPDNKVLLPPKDIYVLLERFLL